jgi:hypothetical protein
MASFHLDNHNVSFTWPCPLTKTKKRSAHSTCAKEFAKEHGFQLIETSNDGNCFFYTLTKFAKRADYEPFLLESSEHRNAMALRQLLVDHIQENFDQYADFLFNNNNAGTIHQQVEGLRKNGAWASEAGDLVPIAAANAFHIHINLYNIEDRGDHDVIHLVPIRSSSPSNVYVSIMRVREGHFQLLWPRSGEFQRSASVSSSASSSAPLPLSATQHVRNSFPLHHEVLSAAHSAVQAAEVAVSVAKKMSSSSSLSQNERALNKISRNLNQLSLGTSGPRRSTRTSRSTQSTPISPPKRRSSTRKNKNNLTSSFYVNNNNNLQRAINASIQYQ